MTRTLAIVVCAWVLWENHSIYSLEGKWLRHYWAPSAAFGTEGGCKEKLRPRTIFPDDDGKAAVSLACFPDTIDPRAPKR